MVMIGAIGLKFNSAAATQIYSAGSFRSAHASNLNSNSNITFKSSRVGALRHPSGFMHQQPVPDAAAVTKTVTGMLTKTAVQVTSAARSTVEMLKGRLTRKVENEAALDSPEPQRVLDAYCQLSSLLEAHSLKYSQIPEAHRPILDIPQEVSKYIDVLLCDGMGSTANSKTEMNKGSSVSASAHATHGLTGKLKEIQEKVLSGHELKPLAKSLHTMTGDGFEMLAMKLPGMNKLENEHLAKLEKDGVYWRKAKIPLDSFLSQGGKVYIDRHGKLCVEVPSGIDVLFKKDPKALDLDAYQAVDPKHNLIAAQKQAIAARRTILEASKTAQKLQIHDGKSTIVHLLKLDLYNPQVKALIHKYFGSEPARLENFINATRPQRLSESQHIEHTKLAETYFQTCDKDSTSAMVLPHVMLKNLKKELHEIDPHAELASSYEIMDVSSFGTRDFTKLSIPIKVSKMVANRLSELGVPSAMQDSFSTQAMRVFNRMKEQPKDIMEEALKKSVYNPIEIALRNVQFTENRVYTLLEQQSILLKPEAQKVVSIQIRQLMLEGNPQEKVIDNVVNQCLLQYQKKSSLAKAWGALKTFNILPQVNARLANFLEPLRMSLITNIDTPIHT